MAFPFRGQLVTHAGGWLGKDESPEGGESGVPWGVPTCSARWVLNVEFEAITRRWSRWLGAWTLKSGHLGFNPS